MTNLLIVFDNVPQMVSARVMRFSNRHRIVRKIYIAVVTEEFWHFGGEEGSRREINAEDGALEVNIKLPLDDGCKCGYETQMRMLNTGLFVIVTKP